MLRIRLHSGRLRRMFTATLAVAGCLGGWVWFGNSGTALLALWAWARWPRWKTRTLRVDLAQLRLVRLGVWSVVWVERPLCSCQVFADEMTDVEYAQLRRELKSRVL